MAQEQDTRLKTRVYSPNSKRNYSGTLKENGAIVQYSIIYYFYMIYYLLLFITLNLLFTAIFFTHNLLFTFIHYT